MLTRPFGRTGWQVSALTFGAWQLGGTWGTIDAGEGQDALLAAMDCGINLIDTAAAYGKGRSEEIVGRALALRPGAEVRVATKVLPLGRQQGQGRIDTIRGQYPAAYLRGEVEASLRRLGRDHIDLLQLHLWVPDGLEDLGWRGFYLLCAVPPMVALPLLFLVPADLPRLRKASSLGRARLPGLRNPVRQMALVYCMFSASYLTFAGFLPSVAVDDFGYSTREASMLAVWAALIIVPANVATAFACKHGFGRRRLLGISLIGMALFGAVFFNGDVLVQARVLSGIAFAICAGMAPAIFWESIPRLSDSSGMPAAIISGIFYQASGLGQLVGPILAGLAVDAAGAWYAAASAPILSGFVVTMLLIRHKYA